MPKQKFENPLLSTRYASVHGEFKPDGNADGYAGDNIAGLRDLWIEVQHHLNRVQSKELRKKEREQREFHDAVDKLSPIIRGVMTGKKDAAKRSDKVIQLVPDEAVRTKGLEWFSQVIN